jgi:hypothetical protein
MLNVKNLDIKCPAYEHVIMLVPTYISDNYFCSDLNKNKTIKNAYYSKCILPMKMRLPKT